MDFLKAKQFKTFRLPVFASRGIVATTQPLASQAGLRILQQGGNAADAAVAIAAALNVTEPCSTGIGGDASVLFYDGKKKSVECLSGYGNSPAKLTLELVRAKGVTDRCIPSDHSLAVTVPGAGQLWEDSLLHWGSLSLKQVLEPAIELCEGGFVVGCETAGQWSKALHQLKGPGQSCFKNKDYEAPSPGELMKNPDLGQTFRRIAEHGMKKGFYTGSIAECIVSAVEAEGGVLSLEDLASHSASVKVEPISTNYRGFKVWQVPPPSQGIVVISALNHLEKLLDPSKMQWGGEDALHAQIEALRLAFHDALQLNADPSRADVPVSALLSKDSAELKRSRYKLQRTASSLKRRGSLEDAGLGPNGGETVYFCVVDSDGNACSFINSNFKGFGSGIVPAGCGFSIQNRAHGFLLEKTHPNCVGPNKRPYHTIIPGLCTNSDGSLFCAYGVMGGFMQPQGHLQVLSNLIDFKMSPQSALDAPRFCLVGLDAGVAEEAVEESKVCFEEGINFTTQEGLRRRGHKVTDKDEDFFFGRGQVICCLSDQVFSGGTDPRADGIVIGW